MSDKLIFWDWSGTLADESRLDKAVCRSMEQDLARNRGIPFAEAEALFNRHLKALEGTWPWHDYVRHGEALDIDWKRSQEAHLELLTVVEGAPEILALSRERGYRNILATNAVGRVARLRVDHAGLSDHFDSIIGSDEAGALKSEGRHFQLGLERFSGDPGRSFSIGDNPVQDIRPAGRLGLATVFCESGRHLTHYHSEHLNENHNETVEPDFRIRRLLELESII